MKTKIKKSVKAKLDSKPEIAMWSALVAPFSKYAAANLGAVMRVAERMQVRFPDKKHLPVHIRGWIAAGKQHQPRYVIGKAFLEEAEAVMRDNGK